MMDEFTVDQNYQRVYRNLLTKFRDCMGEGWAGAFASFHVVEGLYPDLGEAEISHMMTNAGTKNYYMHVEIKEVTADKTSVKAYVQLSTWKRQLEKVRPWATDPAATCS